jgi:cysteinyl-tRNA synthetase
MAAATLGLTVDVLVGGEDLAFPHHAYQAAMVEAAAGVTPFARRRLHVGAVAMKGAKMAKSTGNLVLVADLLEHHQPAAVRLLLLDRPWSAGWEFQSGQLDAAAARLERLYAAGARPGSESGHGAVLAALLDDLDVDRALAVAEEEGGAAARFLLRVLSLA